MNTTFKHTLLAAAVAVAVPVTATAADYYYNVQGHQNSAQLSGVNLSYTSIYWGPANNEHSGAGNHVYLGAHEYQSGGAAGGYALSGATAPVSDNSLTISGGKFVSSVSNYGGYGVGVNVERNKVRIEGGENTSLKHAIVYGGHAVGGDVVANTVEIETDGEICRTFGGVAEGLQASTKAYDVKGNTVKLVKGVVARTWTSNHTGADVFIVGGQNNAGGNAIGNAVEIFSADAELARAIGGTGTSYNPTLNAVPSFSENKVIVHEGAQVGIAYGASASGLASVHATLSDNVVEIAGKVLETAAAARVETYSDDTSAGTVTITNNRLVLKSGSAVTADVAAVSIEMPETLAKRQKFVSQGNELVVEKGADVSRASLYGVLFSPVNQRARAASAQSDVSIKGATLVLDKWQGTVNNVSGFEAMDVRVDGDVDASKAIMTVTGKADLPEDGLKNVTLTMSEGAVEAYKQGGHALKLLDVAEGGTLAGKVVGEATTQKVQNESGLIFADAVLGEDGSMEVGEFRTSTKAHGYFEGVSAMLSISAQSADLAAGSGLKQTLDAMTDGDVHTIGVMEGSSYRWQTGSSINVRAMSALAGAAAKFGDVDAAAYLEFGHSDFDTASVFNSKGDGEYYGVGALARWHVANGFYTEGSVRMGWLDAGFDGDAATGGFDQSGLYAGFHLGGGCVFALTDASSLDVFAQYFYTHQSFDNVKVAASDMTIDDAESSRTRLGARYTYAASAWRGWAGLAWDHEFDGETGGTTSGVALSDAPTLEGNAAIAECGVSWQDAASPWGVNVRLGGYAGDRDGVFGSLGAYYRF